MLMTLNRLKALSKMNKMSNRSIRFICDYIVELEVRPYGFFVFKPCEYYNPSIVNQTYKTSILLSSVAVVSWRPLCFETHTPCNKRPLGL